MKKIEKDFEEPIRTALRGKQVPILVLDKRWHTLFPMGQKPSDIKALEDKLNKLLKQQGKLVNELKELRVAKKRLMDGIVAGMDDDNSKKAQKKKNNQQRLLKETSQRIQDDKDELILLPKEIQRANEDLLILGAKYCFERMKNGDEYLKELNEEMKELKARLVEIEEEKRSVEEGLDSGYSLMHNILGHDIMNMYDDGKV